MIAECFPGQRWISNTEPELGLGIVFEVADRRVVITYPAGDERRIYALDNAPLTRVRYRISDRIRDEEGSEIIISGIDEIENCVVYTGVTADGREAQIHEIELDSFVQFSRPLDRLFTGQIDSGAKFRLRVDTLNHHQRHRMSPVYGLLGPRVQLLPHQFYIASVVASRHAPRVLLADEVGLGKTIEAGLITHRLLLTGRAERVLIVVPDSLVHQWLVEMLRRFNLHFSIIDEGLAAEIETSEEQNPFESAQLILSPQSFITSDDSRLQQAVEAGWDLMIVDEAHHLAWSESEISREYHAIAKLASASAGLLLLTATPEQLGVAGHFARLALLDPHRYADLGKFKDEEAAYAEVSALIAEISTCNGPLGPDLLATVGNYIGSQRAAALNERDQPAKQLTEELLDRHGTGRVLFRNCRDNVEGFPERRVQLYPLALPAPYEAFEVNEDTQALCPESIVEDWQHFDPRVDWLVDWIKDKAGEKALIICARKQTAQVLEEWLRLRKGVRSAVFHEDLDLVQRDRAAAYFADDEENAEVLICSEIGSEGRNFQFAHHLVLFDLPLNPDLLEQRIGRLDRIGQQATVEIHVPYFEHSASHILARWIHEGLDAFERVSPAAPALRHEFANDLIRALNQPRDGAHLQTLLENTHKRGLEISELLQAGRDRLIELNSFDDTVAENIIAEVRSAEERMVLRDYMDLVFDAFGVEHEENDIHSEVVQPGDHMSCESFPALPEGGLTITFDRAQAQTRDEMHFLTWEHPMVAGAIDMVLGSEFGNSNLGVVKNADLKPGTILVEGFFVIVCPAPKTLRVERFLAATTLRVVVDDAGEERTQTLTIDWLDQNIRDIPAMTAQKILPKIRDQAEALSDHAAHIAESRQEPLVDEAIAMMHEEMEIERERLIQLAKINPNIREEEIKAIERDEASYLGYLKNAQLKLDAVRIAMVV
ncbi:MAG: RNA polymerase-associated protein RapA [Pseudomonadota bacterium]